MTERPILPLPARTGTERRLVGQQDKRPRTRAAPGGQSQQSTRFSEAILRLENAFRGDDATTQLQADPIGIAPERALVLVAAAPIANLIRVARDAGLEILSELDLDDYALPGDMAVENADAAQATLYVTMPSEAALRTLLGLWRRYEEDDEFPQVGETPWRNLFDLLAEMRRWGPEDRLTERARRIIVERLPLDDETEVQLELEIWPTRNAARRLRWRRAAEARVEAFGGRVISRATIDEDGSTFVYDALLVGMPAGVVREMIESPAAPEGLATLDGIQFVLPQTIGQSVPGDDEATEDGLDDEDQTPEAEAFDATLPARAVLLDATPVAAHPDLDDGVVIEDVHDLGGRSQVAQRRHATSMASLILRGDLEADGEPVVDSRLLSIPVLIDGNGVAISPSDRLFVDMIHTALVQAFDGDDPLAPDAFVVNLSIGVLNGQFDGRLSALGRLLDWWAARAGILFVVSAGNVSDPLELPDVSAIAFEDATDADRQVMVEKARRAARHARTLLAPSEGMNVLTVGAASLDAKSSARTPPSGVLSVQDGDAVLPAISSGSGLGVFKTIKPDLLAVGGRHDVRARPAGENLSLRVASPDPTSGLWVAAPGTPAAPRGGRRRERGTSCAAALTTRSILHSAAALTGPEGPFEGRELPRRDLALLTRALAVHGARWPETATTMRSALMRAGTHERHASTEAVAAYGYGLLDQDRMCEAPIMGSTLVGLGTVRRDGARLFDMPLPPSLSGDKIDRSLFVTLAWFSPIDAARARYRLAKLEAVAGDDDDTVDKGWGLALKGDPPPSSAIGYGSVWSRRLVQRTKKAPTFSNGEVVPIRVQCRDGSGGGLSPDEDIRFAVAVTLQLPLTAHFDVQQEINDLVRIRLQQQ